MAHGAAHRLGGHIVQAPLLRQPLCQFTVGYGLAIGNLQQQLPDALGKGAAPGSQGQGGHIRLPAAEIGIQPAAGAGENLRLSVGRFRQAGREILLPFQPHAGEGTVLRCHQVAAIRGGIKSGLDHSSLPSPSSSFCRRFL